MLILSKVGLDLGMCHIVARGGLFFFFQKQIKIMYAKAIRAHILYLVECCL